MGTHFLAVAGAGFRRRVVGNGKQESLFCGRAFPIVENASGLDADLEFVGCTKAECGADFKENGRVEAGQPLLFLDDFFTARRRQSAGLTPKANDLEAAMKASGFDLRSGQQSGGVLIMGIRAVELNLHDGTHWIALPMI